MDIRLSSFGHLADGREVVRYSLCNDAGMQVDIITYGAIITAIHVPDRHGKLDDVVGLERDDETRLTSHGTIFRGNRGRSRIIASNLL